MATYKPYKKTESGKEEIKIPYSVLSNPPDLSAYAKLAGGNTFTGKQTLNSPASDGYSINASGYIKGSWLQSSAISNKGANTGKVCVFDNSGWIYYRTPAEILSEAGGATTSQIPTVNNGTLTIQKNGTTVATFSANQSSSVTANITVPTKVSQLTNDSGYTANKGTVTQVKINGTTKSPDSAGLVDLGTISGGGGSGAKTYRDYIYADEVTTIFENNEYGNAFIFATNDGGQGLRTSYSIYVNGVKTDILITGQASDYVDNEVCINISRFNYTSISSIIVNVFYKNTVKTLHINDAPDSTVDLRYTDDENQSTTLFLNITKGTT